MTVTTISRDVAVRTSAHVAETDKPATSENAVITYTNHPITINTNVMAVLAGLSGVGATTAEINNHDDLRSWLVIVALLFIGLALCGLSDDYTRRKKTDDYLSSNETA